MMQQNLEQTCGQCGKGHIRSFRFSVDKAILRCDNVECDSVLDSLPWDNIVNVEVSEQVSRLPHSRNRQICSGSSNSSGVVSDIRSPLMSPAPSQSSITDKEVELLLRRSYAPLQASRSRQPRCKTKLKPKEKAPPALVKEVLPQSSPHHELKPLSNCDSFFELLDELDLESAAPEVKKETPVSKTSYDDLGLDIVTTELESWMSSFGGTPLLFGSDDKEKNVHRDNFEEGVFKNDNSFNLVEGRRMIKSDLRVTNSGDSISRNGYKSTFLQVALPQEAEDLPVTVDSSKDEMLYEQGDSLPDILNGAFKPDSDPLDGICDVVKDLSSLCETQFLSPAASAASDDSGYTEEDQNKVAILSLAQEREGYLKSLGAEDDLEEKRSPESNEKEMCPHVDVKNLVPSELEVSASEEMLNFHVLPAIVTSEMSQKLKYPSSLENESSDSDIVDADDDSSALQVDASNPPTGTPTNVPTVESRSLESHVSPTSESPNSEMLTVAPQAERVEVSSQLNMEPEDQGGSDHGDFEIDSLMSQDETINLSALENIRMDSPFRVCESPPSNGSSVSREFAFPRVGEDESSDGPKESDVSSVVDNCNNGSYSGCTKKSIGALLTSEISEQGSDRSDTSPVPFVETHEDQTESSSHSRSHLAPSLSHEFEKGPQCNVDMDPESTGESGSGRGRGWRRRSKRGRRGGRGMVNHYKLLFAEEDRDPQSSKRGRRRGRGHASSAAESSDSQSNKRLREGIAVTRRQSRQILGSIEVQAPSPLPGRSLQEDDDDDGSLRRSLSSLVNANLPVEGKSYPQNRNLTNLSLRRLHSETFKEDPWSLAEFYLEELNIEVVLQGKPSHPLPQLSQAIRKSSKKDKFKVIVNVQTSDEEDSKDSEENESVSQNGVPRDSSVANSISNESKDSKSPSDQTQKIDRVPPNILKSIKSLLELKVSDGNCEIGTNDIGDFEMKDYKCADDVREWSTKSNITETDKDKQVNDDDDDWICDLEDESEDGLQEEEIKAMPPVSADDNGDLLAGTPLVSADSKQNSSSAAPVISADVIEDLSLTSTDKEKALLHHPEAKELKAEKGKMENLRQHSPSIGSELEFKDNPLCTSNSDKISLQVTCTDKQSSQHEESSLLPILKDSLGDTDLSQKVQKDLRREIPSVCDSLAYNTMQNEAVKEDVVPLYRAGDIGNVNILNTCAKENVIIDMPKKDYVDEEKLNPVIDSSIDGVSDDIQLAGLQVQAKHDSNKCSHTVPKEGKSFSGLDKSNEHESSSDSIPSPTSSPHYLVVSPVSDDVRAWIGADDDVSLGGKGKSEHKSQDIPQKSGSVFSNGLNSKYFSSLLKNLDFDDTFLQCPQREQPSKLLHEHITSSLFFGETAGDYPPRRPDSQNSNSFELDMIPHCGGDVYDNTGTTSLGSKKRTLSTKNSSTYVSTSSVSSHPFLSSISLPVAVSSTTQASLVPVVNRDCVLLPSTSLESKKANALFKPSLAPVPIVPITRLSTESCMNMVKTNLSSQGLSVSSSSVHHETPPTYSIATSSFSASLTSAPSVYTSIRNVICSLSSSPRSTKPALVQPEDINMKSSAAVHLPTLSTLPEDASCSNLNSSHSVVSDQSLAHSNLLKETVKSNKCLPVPLSLGKLKQSSNCMKTLSKDAKSDFEKEMRKVQSKSLSVQSKYTIKQEYIDDEHDTYSEMSGNESNLHPEDVDYDSVAYTDDKHDENFADTENTDYVSIVDSRTGDAVNNNFELNRKLEIPILSQTTSASASSVVTGDSRNELKIQVPLEKQPFISHETSLLRVKREAENVELSDPASEMQTCQEDPRSLSMMTQDHGSNVKTLMINTIKVEGFKEEEEDDIPIISLDSEDEIQVFMPEKKAKYQHNTDKDEKGGTVKREIDCVSRCNLPDVQPTVGPKDFFIKTLPVPLTKIKQEPVETERAGVYNPNPFKLPAQPERVREKRKLSDDGDFKSLKKPRNIVPGVSKEDEGNINEARPCCGILDNSVVHDVGCCCPELKEFLDFNDDVSHFDEPPDNVRLYVGSKKTNFKLYKDLISSEELNNLVASDDKICLTSSKPYTYKISSPHSSQFGGHVHFGNTKSSPQYDIYPSSEVSDSGPGLLDFHSNDHKFFGWSLSSSESSASPPQTDDDNSNDSFSVKGNDDSVSLDNTPIQERKLKRPATKRDKTLLTNMGYETGTSVYYGSEEESESDVDQIRKLFKIKDGQKSISVGKIQITNSKGEVLETLQPRDNPNTSVGQISHPPSNPTVPLSVNAPQLQMPSSVNSSSVTAYVNIHSSKKDSGSASDSNLSRGETSQEFTRSSALSSSKYSSQVLHQPQSSFQLSQPDSHGSVHSFHEVNHPVSRTNPKVLIIPHPSKVNHKSPAIPILHQSKKPIVQPNLTQNPRANHPAFSSQLGSRTQPLITKPSLPLNAQVPQQLSLDPGMNLHTVPLVSVSDSTNTRQSDVKSKLDDTQETSQIDYQFPSVFKTHIIVPPALNTSYSHNVPIQENSIYTSCASSSNAVPSQSRSMDCQLEGLSTRNFHHSNHLCNSSNCTTCHSTTSAPFQTIIGGAQPVDTVSYTSNSPSPSSFSSSRNLMSPISSPLPRSDEESVKSLNTTDILSDTSAMIKKVKMCGKGGFYFRPSLALMSAISELRRKSEREAQMDGETSKPKNIILPDAVPISHPIYVTKPMNQSVLMSKSVKHKRKKRRKRRSRTVERRKIVRQAVENSVKQSIKKEEFPEVIVVCIGGKLHMYKCNAENS